MIIESSIISHTTFIVQASLMVIVIYDRNIFIIQATAKIFHRLLAQGLVL